MEKANLPTEKAIEPLEEAHQPQIRDDHLTPKLPAQPTKKKITFADEPDHTDNDTPSQMSSSYKEILSQPAPELPHREKLAWLQKRRTRGLYVQCDDCQRWRHLPHVLDSYELPKQWYCRMNPDPSNADCSIPETLIRVREEEDLIHSEYSAGSVVWARMSGWPWWPAMVDDCPDVEQYYWLDGFSDIPTYYNVVFFDTGDVTRAWISSKRLKPYVVNKDFMDTLLQRNKYKTRLRAAVKQADDAIQLPLEQRLQKYSFLTKYPGNINSPKKISKRELKRHEKYLKKKIQIEEFEFESEDEILNENSKAKAMNNVIILGTPKQTNTDLPKIRTSRELNKNENNLKKKICVQFDASSDELEDKVPAKKSKTKARNNVILLGTPKKQIVHTVSTFLDKDELDAMVAPESQETPKTEESEPSIQKEVDMTETELNTVSSDNIKKDSSLAVQVGSVDDLAMEFEEHFDDDTSKTYVPEKEEASLDSTQ